MDREETSLDGRISAARTLSSQECDTDMTAAVQAETDLDFVVNMAD